MLRKGHHDNWCNIENQKTNNPNNQSPQKPSSNNGCDEKNDDKTTSFVMAVKTSKERMSIHHHLDFLLMKLKQTVQQLQAKKNKRLTFSTIRS